MTKKELEQEAIGFRINLKEQIICDDDFERLEQFDVNVEEAYIAGAEPREERIAELEKENTELKTQIEKMKCCGNCKHFDFNEPNYCHKGVYRERQYACSEWELGN